MANPRVSGYRFGSQVDLNMLADLPMHLVDLNASLEELDAESAAPGSVADVFNALLREAKNQRSDDPRVVAIEPVGRSRETAKCAEINCGTLQILILRLLLAFGDPRREPQPRAGRGHHARVRLLRPRVGGRRFVIARQDENRLHKTV